MDSGTVVKNTNIHIESIVMLCCFDGYGYGHRYYFMALYACVLEVMGFILTVTML